MSPSVLGRGNLFLENALRDRNIGGFRYIDQEMYMSEKHKEQSSPEQKEVENAGAVAVSHARVAVKRKVGRPSNHEFALEHSIRLLHADGKGMGVRKLSKTLRISVAKIYEALKAPPVMK